MSYKHGTTYGRNMGCECDRCRMAASLDTSARKARRLLRPIPDHVHPSANGYQNYDCRCPGCTKAWSDYQRERSHG